MEVSFKKSVIRYLPIANSPSEGTTTQTSSYSGEEHRNEENVARALVNICETLQSWSFM